MTLLVDRDTLREPTFGHSLAADTAAVQDYAAGIDAAVQRLGPGPQRNADAKRQGRELTAQARAVKERFFRHHAAALYDEATDGCLDAVRISELVYALADRYPGLMPTRARIGAERALMQQSAKDGHEIDQGLFIAHV